MMELTDDSEVPQSSHELTRQEETMVKNLFQGLIESANDGTEFSMEHISQDPVYAQLLCKIEHYPLVFPDALIEEMARKNGVVVEDQRLLRIVGLAVQKTLSDIAIECTTRLKNQNSSSKKSGKDTEYTLSHEVLEDVLKKFGYDARKPPYFE